ncbi:unnamed protein product, partial [Nesidiocoris tenuis]
HQLLRLRFTTRSFSSRERNGKITSSVSDARSASPRLRHERGGRLLKDRSQEMKKENHTDVHNKGGKMHLIGNSTLDIFFSIAHASFWVVRNNREIQNNNNNNIRKMFLFIFRIPPGNKIQKGFITQQQQQQQKDVSVHLQNSNRSRPPKAEQSARKINRPAALGGKREVLCVISAQLAQYWLQTGNFFSNIWIHECDITRRCFENPLIWRYLRAINTFVTDYEKRVKAIMSGLSGDIRFPSGHCFLGELGRERENRRGGEQKVTVADRLLSSAGFDGVMDANNYGERSTNNCEKLQVEERRSSTSDLAAEQDEKKSKTKKGTPLGVFHTKKDNRARRHRKVTIPASLARTKTPEIDLEIKTLLDSEHRVFRGRLGLLLKFWIGVKLACQPFVHDSLLAMAFMIEIYTRKSSRNSVGRKPPVKAVVTRKVARQREAQSQTSQQDRLRNVLTKRRREWRSKAEETGRDNLLCYWSVLEGDGIIGAGATRPVAARRTRMEQLQEQSSCESEWANWIIRARRAVSKDSIVGTC